MPMFGARAVARRLRRASGLRDTGGLAMPAGMRPKEALHGRDSDPLANARPGAILGYG